MSPVYIRSDCTSGAFSTEPRQPNGQLPVQNELQGDLEVATCLARNPGCTNPRAVKEDGSLHRLCAAHRRQPWGRAAANQQGDREQLHVEPLPFEVIPFDSGQAMKLRVLPLETLDDLSDGEAILNNPTQAQGLDEVAFFGTFF